MNVHCIKFKKVAIFMALFILWGLGNLFAQHPPLGGGSGTSGSPYEIADTAHLRILADYVNAGNSASTNGVYYKLMDDIDLNDYADWKPIGDSSTNARFRGNFDGNGKTVRNLTINGTTNYSGLFGYVNGATIQNLGVENCNVSGSDYTGGLAGCVHSSQITQCYITGKVSGDNYVGGLTGRAYGASPSSTKISNCYVSGSVSGTGTEIGGLIGQAAGTTSAYNVVVANCYTVCNISGNSRAGGIVGFLSNNSSLSYSYATGNVSGASNVGGIAGNVNNNNSSVIRNCVAANDTIKVSTSGISSINRISGNSTGTFNNNYAFNSVVLIRVAAVIVRNDDTTVNGRGKSLDSLKSFAFYNAPENWYNITAWSIDSATADWKICDSLALPFLRWQNINCINTIKAMTVDANGTITPNETVSVNYTDNQTFLFSAVVCYEIDSLWIDGIYSPDSISAGSYTFKNVTENHTIDVSFKRLPSDDSLLIFDTICQGENYTQNGFNESESGIYNITLQNHFGCDSIIIILNLTVNPLPDVPIINKNGNVLTSSKSDSYQWYLENQPIVGATAQSYTYAQNGIYFVEIANKYDCKIKSEDINVVDVGIETITNRELRIYPNPTTGHLTISLPNPSEGGAYEANVEIYDVTGRKVAPLSSPEGGKASSSFGEDWEGIIDISHLANGVYFLKIENKTFKIIKQ